MDDLKQKIVGYSIEHWHNNFTGVSGIDVAGHLGLPHEVVLRAFDELEQEGKGTIRRNVTLYQVSVSVDGPMLGETKPVVTSIFFPSAELLTESFYSSPLHQSNIPEYKARLHKGGSQTQLVYFSSEVLRKYLDHIEIFEVEDFVTGGYILRRDGADFPLFRFGKRKLAGGQVVVAAILWDLAELPEKEQAYWYSYEVENPHFTREDPDFVVFCKRDFEAEFLDDGDPLQNVLAEIGNINRLLKIKGNGLFSAGSNLYLSYPPVNTYKSFCDSCSELYKLVGPDSLQEKVLRDLLTTYFNYQQQNFSHPDTGRPLGKLDLLKRLCGELECEKLPLVIERIKQHRINADHRVIAPQRESKDYLADFRNLLRELCEALHQFRSRLEMLVRAEH